MESNSSEETQRRYNEERKKRLDHGSACSLSVTEDCSDSQHQSDLETNPERSHLIEDGSKTLVLIIGCGYTGILHAIRLLEEGFKREDILILDKAGGYGGTWYWNQYPGLMCDAEAYIYMPLLEELQYVPTSKYCGGPELRRYAERMARHHRLESRTVFRSVVDKLDWSEEESIWQILVSLRGARTSTHQRQIKASFVILATGLFIKPKRPIIPGLDGFTGHTFHASRWDYNYTGGSPDDPALTRMADKTVGLVGTGATAIQTLGPLANYSRRVLVFQRTPASVDFRKNRETDLEAWSKEVAFKPGWQAERRWNFYRHVANLIPSSTRDMVDDAMSNSPSLSALSGAPYKGKMNDIAEREHIAELTKLDHERQARIRARVRDAIESPDVAASLTNWYPSWCKRPLFHDEYLPTFNRQNVQLIDTDGKALEGISGSEVLVGDARYHVDCLIFATGYESPYQGDPGSRAGIQIKGKRGLSLSDKWAKGPQSLHGIWSHGFPNLFWSGPEQAALEINYTHAADHFSRHISKIISYAVQKHKNVDVTVHPRLDAEREWTDEVMALSSSFAASANCTPSYFNNEGQDSTSTSQNVSEIQAKRSAWGDGLENYVARLAAWRQDKMQSEVEILIS